MIGLNASPIYLAQSAIITASTTIIAALINVNPRFYLPFLNKKIPGGGLNASNASFRIPRVGTNIEGR